MSDHASQQKETAAFDSLDSLLSGHFNTPAEQLAPSSGFTVSIMDAIYQEAAMPPPIPFPWRHALFGLVTAVFALIALLVYVANNHIASPHDVPRLTHSFLVVSITSTQITIASMLMAIVLSAAAIVASFRLAGGSR